eukprot:5408417-Amphidinium_carterae.1
METASQQQYQRQGKRVKDEVSNPIVNSSVGRCLQARQNSQNVLAIGNLGVHPSWRRDSWSCVSKMIIQSWNLIRNNKNIDEKRPDGYGTVMQDVQLDHIKKHLRRRLCPIPMNSQPINEMQQLQ